MKLVLTLSLIFAACLCAPAATASAADSPQSGARWAAFDGVARRAARARRGVRRRARGRAGAQRGRASRVRAAASPVVTELDGAGLLKLLRREGSNGAEARPLLINFWATWCEPCRTEFPDLVKIDAEFRPRGLEFVLISVDDVSEIKTGVPEFLRKMRAEMPAYLLNATDSDAAVTSVDPTWHGELPATFLFDRTGKLAFKHTGIVKPDELRAALEKVLATN